MFGPSTSSTTRIFLNGVEVGPEGYTRTGKHWSPAGLRRKAAAAAFGVSVAFARARSAPTPAKPGPRLAPVFASTPRSPRNSLCPCGCGRKAKACANR